MAVTLGERFLRTVRRRLDVVFVVALSYIPLLFTERGQIGADTKPYLYLDPGRLLEGAASMWQPDVGLGAVPHQNIGYLWPMGPYYWLMENLGFADWVAQRIWIGTTICAATLGVRYLLRTLGWRNSGVIVASLAYGLSPYGLAYFARISAILLPWAGLPWMLGLTIAAVRSKGWRHPALFALVAATVGSTNATSLLLIGIVPVLWLAYQGFVERELMLVVKPGLRIGLLTALTGLWWVAGVRTQGAFGPPVLRFTETYEAVADSSTAPEILRGLGYWFFYGNDHLGEWVEPSRAYTARTVVLILSFAIPIAALVSGAVTRFRDRAFFVTLVVLGTLIGVAGHPYDAPSALGQVFKDFTRSDAGLALRSTPRATPLVALGMAVMLGAGVAALARWRPSWDRPLTFGVCLLVVLNMSPLWNGQMVAQYLQRPEDLPVYWTEAIAALDARGTDSRILEVPGSDFSSYRWGNTVEPITPGLTDRPYVARELVPFGSEPSVALTLALDKTFQEGTYNPEALAPIARLMSVGDVVLRADLQFERFRTPRPQLTWADLLRSPGLGEPTGYGEPVPNIAGPEQPLIDEIALAIEPTTPHPAPVVVFPVDDPLPITRARSTDGATIIAGDAESLIDAASLGLVDPERLVVFSATLADHPELEAALLDEPAVLLLTDGNRKVARRWGTIRENTGFIEQADEEAINYDAGDYRLDVFGNAGGAGGDPDPATQTVAIQSGATVTATDYGNPVTFTVDDRPASALDGDLDTAWRVGAFAEVRGERLIIELPEPQEIDHLQLTQPLIGFTNRWITELRVHANDASVDITLGPESRQAEGQRVEVDLGSTARIELEVLETNLGERPRYNGASSVGFAEVGIDGVLFRETIRLPTDLLDRVPNDLDHNLGVTITRTRSDAREPVRFDPEESMRRTFTLPSERTFSLDGEARLSAYVDDGLIDTLLLGPGATSPVTARSSERLAGDLASRARAAIDGDLATAWQTAVENPTGEWLEITTDDVVRTDQLVVHVVADGRHSVPTQFQVSADGADPLLVDVPEVVDEGPQGRTAPVTLTLPAELSFTSLRLTASAVRPVLTKDWYSGNAVAMPLGIAEIEGFARSVPNQPLDTGCRIDLLAVNGTPIGVRVSGDHEDAVDRNALDVALCDGPITVPAGEVLIETSRGRDTGIDLDRLALLSGPGGRPGIGFPTVSPTPTVTVTEASRTSQVVQVTGATEPFVLVLGQSQNRGWTATLSDGTSLGEPTLVDGFANGWLVTPDAEDLTISLEWTPQKTVNTALLLSLIAVLASIVLAWRGQRDPGPGITPGLEPQLLTEVVSARRVTPGGWPIIVAAAGIGVFAVVNLPEWRWSAFIVAAAFVATTRVPRLAISLGAACLAVAGAYTTIEQYRHRYPPDFGWPQFFEAIHVVGVLCVLFLAAEVVRSVTEMRHLGSREDAT